jgi:hypothetical protein
MVQATKLLLLLFNSSCEQDLNVLQVECIFQKTAWCQLLPEKNTKPSACCYSARLSSLASV